MINITERKGITYEEMREFYSEAENREQSKIVMIQRLMIRVSELEKELKKQALKNSN